MNDSPPSQPDTPPQPESALPQVPLPQTVPIGGLPIGQIVFPPVAGGMIFGVAQQSWQAPYPPPEAAERLEALHPGTFGRILVMAEREQAARIASVDSAQAYRHKEVARGHWLGFGISVSALASAVVCALASSPWVGAACVGVPVLAVALALVQSARQSAFPTVSLAAPPTPAPSALQVPPQQPNASPNAGEGIT